MKSARPKTKDRSVAQALADFCVARRVGSIYTVCGGGNGVLYSALAESGIPFAHVRREDACVYAAAEDSLDRGRPSVVCVTSGEAVAHAMSAIPSARAEGATLLVLSGCSNPSQFGRAAIQGTDLSTMANDFYRSGPLLDFSRLMVDARELPWVLNRLSVGFQRPNGFVAHLALPRELQQARVPCGAPTSLRVTLPAPSAEALEYCGETLGSASFATLVGFGARHAAAEIRRLIELTGTRTLTTPRAKGTVLDAPCIGLGGTRDYYPRGRPERLLVLGSRLGEAACGWDAELLPEREILHVDLDPSCFGASFDFPTYGVQAEVLLFLRALLTGLEARASSLPLARRA